MFFLNFHRNSAPPGHSITLGEVTKYLMPFAEPDRRGFFADDRVFLVQCVTWNTAPSKREPVPFHDPVAGIHGASWARIDNREELGSKLDISRSEMERICDTKLICRSYLKWRGDCVDHLIGDFVFALYDEPEKRVFCGRDHMGVKPLYYHLSGDRFVCATSLPPLLHLKDLSIQIRRQWIVDYLTHLSMSFNKTPYNEILKLPPAHTLAVNLETHRLNRYFDLSAIPELKLKESREYVEAYREQLETAVKCRLNTTYPLGSELSGGLDSSTITAYAARFFDQPLTRLHAFAFARNELEPQHILAVSQAYGLPHTHVVAGLPEDQKIIRERSLRILGHPVEHGNATSHEPFYQLAERFDVRTLLSGFGGDEFGTTIHGYMVPMELILQLRYRDLMHILPGKPLSRFLRLVKMGLRQIKTRNFTRPAYNPRFLKAWKERWPHQIVAPAMVRAYDLKRRYFEAARFDAGYTDLRRFTLEKRWKPFIPTRMENCTLMAAGRKVDYRWPLLDIRLVKLWLSIPSEENYFRGMGRYLHRRAVEGLIPDPITWKKSKYMGNIIVRDLATKVKLDAASVADLHPALKELIDVGKLAFQAEQSASLKDAQNDGSAVKIRRNLHAINELDYWLKQQ